MHSSCLNCRFLDKARHKPSDTGTAHKLYGCNSGDRGGFVCGWADGDKDLKWQSCSFFEERPKSKQINLFEEEGKNGGSKRADA